FLHRGEALPPVTLPTSLNFWKYFFAVMSLALGQPGDIWSGVVLKAMTVTPFLLTIGELRQGEESVWMRTVVVAAVVSIGLTAAAARTGYGFRMAVQSWHYFSIHGLLVPMGILAWCTILDRARLAMFLVAVGIAVFLL